MFGEKDYQQLKIVQALVDELHFPIEIVAGKLIREESGLALSSRNKRLSETDKEVALLIPQAIERAVELVQKGERCTKTLSEELLTILQSSEKLSVDYLEFCDPNTLLSVDSICGKTLLALAAEISQIRLIDNCILEG